MFLRLSKISSQYEITVLKLNEISDLLLLPFKSSWLPNSATGGLLWLLSIFEIRVKVAWRITFFSL